ncbi:hypothetical protein [Devosia enhydra]|nr:hypothetical protein [Devosia enhydra]
MISSARRFFSASIAIGLLLGGVALGVPGKGKEAAKNPPSENVEQVFQQRNARTLAILDADFPRDHEALLAAARALRHADLTLDQKLERLFAMMSDTRKRYAERLRFAPGPQHRLMMGVLGAFMAEVDRVAGSEVCTAFAQDGTGALFQSGVASQFSAAIDVQSAAYFAAVVAAIENPEIHPPVLEADWSAVFAQMARDGHPLSYVESIAGGSPDDPALCSALSAMFRSAALMPGAPGERFRADFAPKLAGY